MRKKASSSPKVKRSPKVKKVKKMSLTDVHNAFKQAIALTKGKKLTKEERSKVFKDVFAKHR